MKFITAHIQLYDWLHSFVHHGFFSQRNPYRKKASRVEEVIPNMVTSFPIESQHSVDGGSSKDLIERIRGVRKKSGRSRAGSTLTRKGIQVVNERVKDLRSTAIHEPARYIRLVFFRHF